MDEQDRRDVDQFARAWARQARHPHRSKLPLPRRTRFRLAVSRYRDKTCEWLCGHGMTSAARIIWRIRLASVREDDHMTATGDTRCLTP